MEYNIISVTSKNHDIVKFIFEDNFPTLDYNKKNLKFVKKITEYGKHCKLFKSKKYFEEITKSIISSNYSDGIGIGPVLTRLMIDKSINILKYYTLNCLYDMKVIDDKGGNILFLATEMNFPEFIEWLVKDQNFELNKVNNNNETILYYAVRENHFELTKWLIQTNKMNVNHLDKYKNNILFTTCSNNNFEISKWLVENTDINYNQLNNRNENCLFGCMFSRCKVDYELIRYMVQDKKMNQNHEDKGGYTLTYYANTPEVIDFLVDEMKMNLNHISKIYGTNILFSSVLASDKHLTDYLINKRKINKNIIDKRGTNLLMAAVKCTDPKDMINWLLSKHNFDINYINKLGYNIVYAAAQYLDYDLIKWLIMELHINYKSPIYSGHELIDELIYHSRKDSEFNNTINFIKWLVKETELKIKFNYIYSICERCVSNCKNCSCKSNSNINTKQIEIFLKEFGFNINYIDLYYNNTILVNSIINNYDSRFIDWILKRDDIDLFLVNKEIILKQPIYYAFKYNKPVIIDLILQSMNDTIEQSRLSFKNLKVKYLDSIKESQTQKTILLEPNKFYDGVVSPVCDKMVQIKENKNQIEVEFTENEKLKAYISKLKLQLMLNDIEPEEDLDIDI